MATGGATIKRPIRNLGECPHGGQHEFIFQTNGAECLKCGLRSILPQRGPQQMLLTSKADIAIFGGAKGGGKSYALLLETIRHNTIPNFGAVVFRRESPQIYNIGGLWDTSEKIYPALHATPVKSRGEWIFPSGARVKFSHLEYDKDVNAWDGQQVPLIGFDELTLFSEKQFWYMFTINRSTCGVRPLIRATCNPDVESWVAELLKWWIDQDTGYPIQNRAGKLRYFVRADGTLRWADTEQELRERFPGLMPKSFTFIPSRLEDNPALESIDPGYRANLLAQPLVEQERLLFGNWKIRPAAGLKFPRDKWVLKDEVPAGLRLCRFWDKAATAGGTGARTAGVLLGELHNHEALALPRYWVIDCQAGRWGDSEREAKIKSTAILDRENYPQGVTIGMEQEGGSGGKHSAHMTINNLAGFDVYSKRPTTNKAARWSPVASQQQIGKVAIVRGNWDWADFIRELDALAGDQELDKGKLKDAADALSGAFEFLAAGGFHSRTELLCSGGDPGEAGPLTKKEFDELPDFWKDLLGTYRGLSNDDPRTDKIDRHFDSPDKPYSDRDRD